MTEAIRGQGLGSLGLAVGVAAILLAISLGFTETARATGVADSPWPMFQHDPQHTGRSPHVAPSKLGVEWRFQLRGMPGSPAIGADGTIYLPSGNTEDGQGFLYAINPDGTQRWRYELPNSPETNCVIVPTFTTPAVAEDGTIYLHVQSGRTLDGTGHCTAGPGFLYAINSDGSKRWSYQLNFGAGIFTSDNVSSPAIAPDGTIYLTSRDAGIYAINPNGTLKWVDNPESTSISSSPAIAPDGTIYFIIADLHAYTPGGIEKWKAEIGNGVPNSRSPSLAADGTIYACGIHPFACHEVSPAGGLNWSFPLESLDHTTPAIGPDGTTYLVGRDDSAGLYAVNPNGVQRWRAFSEGAPFEKVDHSPVVGGDGMLYTRDDLAVGAGGFFGTIFVVNLDGSQRDAEQMPAVTGTGELNPAIGSDGTLYVPQPSGGTAGEYDPNDQYLAAYGEGADDGPPDGDGGDVGLELTAKRRQRLGRSVKVEAGCEEACAATATGKLVVMSKRRVFKLRKAEEDLAGGDRETLKLKIPEKARRAAQRSLADDGKAKAKITVEALDTAGNSAIAKRGVKLTPG